MKVMYRRLLVGFFVWAAIKAFSLLFSFLEENFESVVNFNLGVVVMIGIYLIGAFFYFKGIRSDFHREGWITGLTWLALFNVFDWVYLLIVAGRIAPISLPPHILALIIFGLVGAILEKKAPKK